MVDVERSVLPEPWSLADPPKSTAGEVSLSIGETIAIALAVVQETESMTDVESANAEHV